MTDSYSCIGLFGPKSRKFLTELFGDFSNEIFILKGMYINISNIKYGFELSFMGELGWEIYIPIKKTKYFEKIKELGKSINLLIQECMR